MGEVSAAAYQSIATAIEREVDGLGFEAALALARLVLRHGGGPVPTRGRRAPFGRPVVKALADAGLVTMVGDSQVTPRVRVTSVANLTGRGGWSAGARVVGADERTGWHVEASPAGVELVARVGRRWLRRDDASDPPTSPR